MDKIKVLEFKHFSPAPGCRWRWEYIMLQYFESDPKPTTYTLVFSNEHLSASEVVDLLVYDDYEPTDYVTKVHARKFRDPTLYEWGQELFDQIPYNYFPQFAQIDSGFNIEPFTWTCDECGTETTEVPQFPSGITGNGGIGIRIIGWLCSDCHYKKEEEYGSV